MDCRRRRFVTLLGSSAALFLPGCARETPLSVTMYKNPSCGCCGKWADHMRAGGFPVVVHDMDDVSPIKAKYKVPLAMGSCHTAVVNGYTIEGHVPADVVRRLFDERPAGVIGLTVPGMPQGAPGMESPDPQSYDVLAFDADGRTFVYARRSARIRTIEGVSARSPSKQRDDALDRDLGLLA